MKLAQNSKDIEKRLIEKEVKRREKLRKSEIIQLWRRRKRKGYVTNFVCVRKSQFSFALTNMYDLHTKNQ